MRQRLRLGTMKPRRLSAGAALVLAAVGISDLPAWAQTFQELHAFGSVANNGSDPEGALIQATDGNFYGTTTAGGASGDGSVFKVSTNGTGYQTLFAFGYPDPRGCDPSGGLLLATDGNSAGNGSHGNGNVFRIIMPGPLLSYTQKSDLR